MTVPNPAPQRVYPLPYDPADDRLSDDLVELVADLIVFLTRHPFITGPDLAELRKVLHGFLYAPQSGLDYSREADPAPVPATRAPMTTGAAVSGIADDGTREDCHTAADFRSGYCEGFLDAVRIATPLSDANLESVLAAWGDAR